MKKRIFTFKQIQMPIPQTVLQPKKKMMSEQVKPDAFEPPCHKLKPSIEAKLETLLKEYTSQFTQDKTSISMTPLTKMTVDAGTSEPVLQKHLSNCHETLSIDEPR